MEALKKEYDRKLSVLDLISGIGGFSLGLERTGGFRTVAFCEIEPFPRKVLAKHWPNVPIFEDVRKLHAEDLPEPVDVICGGYPCQPFSLAGKRKGAKDDRHLWPEIARLLREFDSIGRKPAWCLFENVAGHINMGLDQVLVDLESQGYTAWPIVIPACSVDAPHRRDRVWIVAHSECAERRPSQSCGDVTNRQTSEREKETGWAGTSSTDGGNGIVSNSRCELSQIWAEREWDGRWGDVEQHGCVVADTAQQLLDRCGIEWETWRIKPSISGQVLSNPAIWCEQRGGARSDERRFQNQVLPSVRYTCDRTTERRFCGMVDGFPRWLDEPGDVPRVISGQKNRVNRIKALGNAVVPAVVEVIGRAILEAENKEV